MLRPLRDQILVKQEKRIQSRVIEVISKELPTRGTVVAVGPGKDDHPLDIKVGDKIVYGNGDFLDFPRYEENGETFLVMQEADVCWVVEQSTN